jgi:hypothetical protein
MQLYYAVRDFSISPSILNEIIIIYLIKSMRLTDFFKITPAYLCFDEPKKKAHKENN